MGNSPLDSSLSKEKLQHSLENDLIFLKKVNDDRYGEVKVLQIKDSKPRELVALKTFITSTSKECEDLLTQISLRKKLDLPTIVRIKAFERAELQQYCSHYFKLYVVYEYHEKTLSSELDKRNGKYLQMKSSFAEVEIYHLIDCVLSALILFSNNGIPHSDIRPHTIFFSEEGIFKLNDIQFMSGLNAYTQFLMGSPDPEQCFLAPELFDQLGHRILQPTLRDPQKADVFSLGMTALETALLHEVSSCYDFDVFRVKEDILIEFLDEVKVKYSEELFFLLKNMLLIDSDHRFDYNSVFQSLSPRQEQIKEFNKESFPLLIDQDDIPQNIREERPKESFPKNLHEEIIQKGNLHGDLRAERDHSQKENKEDFLLEGVPYKDLDLLEISIKEALIRSEEAQRRFNDPDTQNIRLELQKDEYKEFLVKREEVIRKSAQARESITQERMKKTVGIIDERDLLDSNKLYEMYLEEYENLRNKEYI